MAATLGDRRRPTAKDGIGDSKEFIYFVGGFRWVRFHVNASPFVGTVPLGRSARPPLLLVPLDAVLRSPVRLLLLRVDYLCEASVGASKLMRSPASSLPPSASLMRLLVLAGLPAPAAGMPSLLDSGSSIALVPITSTPDLPISLFESLVTYVKPLPLPVLESSLDLLITQSRTPRRHLLLMLCS